MHNIWLFKINVRIARKANPVCLHSPKLLRQEWITNKIFSQLNSMNHLESIYTNKNNNLRKIKKINKNRLMGSMADMTL